MACYDCNGTAEIQFLKSIVENHADIVHIIFIIWLILLVIMLYYLIRSGPMWIGKSD